MSDQSLSSNPLSGAVGAGLVLVLVPCTALYMGADYLAGLPTVGLPILAIFGIMILFGALALIASLFSGLGLANRDQPLGLPDGSIRAVIALSLIVLFAIIAIMLYQSLANPLEISGISVDAKDKMARDLGNKVVAIVPVCLPAPTPSPAGVAEDDEAVAPNDPQCSPASYTFYVLRPEGNDAGDFAKQLLTLLGTLMASLTSFYFASRGNEVLQQQVAAALQSNGGGGGGGSGGTEPGGDKGTQYTTASTAPGTAQPFTDDADGCDGGVANPTLDRDLPAATGGVLPS